MPPTVSDRDLRLLIAELARTTPEDVAAVLSMLDPATAARVRDLLARHGGLELPGRAADTVGVNTAGLSGWLAARTLGRPLQDAKGYRMTPAAREALHVLAAAMPGHLAAAAPRPASRFGTFGLFRKGKDA